MIVRNTRQVQLIAKWHDAFVVVAQALHTCLTLSSLYIRICVYSFIISLPPVGRFYTVGFFALLLPTVTEPPSKILCQAIARVYVNAASHALCRYCVQWCRTCGCVITCGLGTYIPCYIYRYVACSTNGYCKYVGEVSASWCWQHMYVCTTSFANYTAWKWRLEKENRDPVPELVAYALMPSFSHASHRCGHTSLSPIAMYTVTGGPQYCEHLGPAP